MNTEHNDQAEALHLSAHYAIKTLKLAALTSELKRVLLDVESVLETRPEVRKLMRGNINHMPAWMGFEDPTAEVLEHLAEQIQKASDGLLDLAIYRSNSERGGNHGI